MSEATIYKRLRPIKLAFIIAPNDRESIKKAIKLNSYLWGGKFNPIIPFCKRIPIYFDKISRPKNCKELIDGYIKNFDPDFIIPMGISLNSFNKGKDDRIIYYKEIINGIYEEYYARYGISLFEILNYFYKKEMKFVRKYPVNLYLPKISKNHKLFLSSVFGNYDEIVIKQLAENYYEPLNITTKKIGIENYLSTLTGDSIPLNAIMDYSIDNFKKEPFTFFTLFIMDSTSSLDIIDFINLRATGIKVLPIALKVINSSDISKFVIKIINRYYDKTEKHSHLTLLKSRTIDSKTVSAFLTQLNVSLKEYDIKKKFVIQNWYPRMWEDFGRNSDHAKAGTIQVKEASEQVKNIEEYVNIKSLSPSFKLNFSGTPRYANEMNVRVYHGIKETFAEVLPEGDAFFTDSFGFIGFREWRISNSGLVNFSSFKKETISFQYPLSERVMIAWFKQRNWDVKLSNAGLIAKEMLNQLGGSWNINLIAKRGLINLFEKMGNGKSLNYKYFRGKLDEIIKKVNNNGDTNFYLKQLIDSKIFKLGLEIQCKICKQNSWFSITEFDYNLTCPKCLNKFKIPSESVSLLKWSYRLIGPFSLPHRSYGIYTVLLSFRFFSWVLDGLTTPLFSFNASNLNKEIEADLALFYQKDKFDPEERELIFVECKSFNEIQAKDISRMKTIMDAFPRCIIIFATLNKKLSNKEQKLLLPLTNKVRRNLINGKPSHQILILTATELYANHKLYETYEKLSDKHKMFAKRIRFVDNIFEELSDITQQLYLNMKPWQKFLEERYNLKTHKKQINRTPFS